LLTLNEMTARSGKIHDRADAFSPFLVVHAEAGEARLHGMIKRAACAIALLVAAHLVAMGALVALLRWVR